MYHTRVKYLQFIAKSNARLWAVSAADQTICNCQLDIPEVNFTMNRNIYKNEYWNWLVHFLALQMNFLVLFQRALTAIYLDIRKPTN